MMKMIAAVLVFLALTNFIALYNIGSVLNRIAEALEDKREGEEGHDD